VPGILLGKDKEREVEDERRERERERENSFRLILELLSLELLITLCSDSLLESRRWSGALAAFRVIRTRVIF